MIALALILAVAGQTTPPPAPPPFAPPAIDCTDANHRAFDFWIGDWDVEAKAAGKVVAHSRIERIADCAISETFRQTLGAGGKAIDYRGRSISSYVPGSENWRQFYIDNGGAASTFDGNLEGRSMVFLTLAGPVTNRMTLEPLADGSVNQRGETSSDGGKTWSPTYNYLYHRHMGGGFDAP